jgi:hypothetical protein
VVIPRRITSARTQAVAADVDVIVGLGHHIPNDLIGSALT